MYEVLSKTSKPQPEKVAIVEHFCFDSTLFFIVYLEKLIQNSFIMSIQI